MQSVSSATAIDLDDWLPALVVGTSSPPSTLNGKTPPWLLRTKHQFGGYACRQAELLGAFIPLAKLPRAAPLLSGFDALACDRPNEKAIRRHAKLAPIHLTAGKRYSDAQLACLQRFLDGAHPPLPRVVKGTEALVVLDGSRGALTGLFGAPVLCPKLPPGVSLNDPDAIDFVMGPLGIYPNAKLRPALLEQLERLAGPPQLLMAWFNSD